MSDHKRVLICGVIFGYGGLEGHFLDLGKLPLVENDAEVTFATRAANPEVLNMPVWREAPTNEGDFVISEFRTENARVLISAVISEGNLDAAEVLLAICQKPCGNRHLL